MKSSFRNFGLCFLFLPIISLAGHDQSGGGTACKADFMDTYKKFSNLVLSQSELTKKFPFLKDALDVLSADRVPLVEIQTQETPIQGCRLAENPLACSIPNISVLQLYCGTGGWESLNQLAKYKHLLHELLWWSPTIRDNNYGYSDAVIKRIQELSLVNSIANLSKNNAFATIEAMWLASEGKTFQFDSLSVAGINVPEFYGDTLRGFKGDVYETTGQSPVKTEFIFMYYDIDQGIFVPKKRYVRFYLKVPGQRFANGRTYFEPLLEDKSSGTFGYVSDSHEFEIRQVSTDKIVIATLPNKDGVCTSFTSMRTLKLTNGKSFCSLMLVIRNK